MVTLTSLWLPIVLSAVFVFIVSSVIHMFLKYHKADFKKLPDEDGVRNAVGNFDIPEGNYIVPCPGPDESMSDKAFQEKVKSGPVFYLTVISNDMSMGSNLIQWFVYCLVVGIFSAYIGVNAVGADGDYLDVFRFVGCAAFMGYALALVQNSIWSAKNWGATLRSVFDGLIYALVTAGTFGWLWP
ncbi:MAG: hypothetical protein R3301_17705 [Saprospiraceae bacterium]|nr:hypothetical protein [Saprospiraceae bacterium]